MKLVLCLMLGLLICSCGGSPSMLEEDQDIEYGTRVHKLPHREAGSPATNASGAHLSYYGGPVIPSARVVQVLYGTGNYAGFVGGSVQPSMSDFYKYVLVSPYMDWLSEYHTSTQTIGRGSFIKTVQIKPSTGRNKSTIPDKSIQTELTAQIRAGVLPAPDHNTIYMVNFPHGKAISQGGSFSCKSGGFCAYHGTFKYQGTEIYYGVLPDMQSGSGCDSGCGSGAPFGNQTSVASHELIEAITDPSVGLATVLGPPLAWYDSAQGEIGDICNASQGTAGGFVVQKEWSNRSGTCKDH